MIRMVSINQSDPLRAVPSRASNEAGKKLWKIEKCASKNRGTSFWISLGMSPPVNRTKRQDVAIKLTNMIGNSLRYLPLKKAIGFMDRL